MGRQPRISVIIPTRNRLDDLLVTLGRIAADASPDVEILVHDDASDVDPAPAVAARFPAVRVFRSDVQTGPCLLRNRLVEMATGEIIIGFDDDCSFETPGAFGAVVDAFHQFPRLGLLSCRIRTPHAALWPARRGAPFRETVWFIACAFAVRREAYCRVGGFDPTLARQGEERDLAAQLLDAGYEIRHTDDIVAEHRYTPVARDHQAIHALAMRNELLFVLKRVPAVCVPWRLVRHGVSHVAFCIRRGWWRALVGGLAGFLRIAPAAVAGRHPISMTSWRRFLALTREQFAIERPVLAEPATSPVTEVCA
jgi:GT2 family glycosyltransferase